MEKNQEIYLFKPEYSEAEVQELAAWFADRLDRLPQSLQINVSSRTDNLKRTVMNMLRVMERKGTSPTFGGYVAHLFLIRERLRLDGME